jgi:hypothetical protein
MRARGKAGVRGSRRSTAQKIERLEKYRAKSIVVNPDIGDVDIYGLVSDTHSTYVNYMRVIDGAVVHGITIELKRRLDEPDVEILHSPSPNCASATAATHPEAIVPFDPGSRCPASPSPCPNAATRKPAGTLRTQRALLHAGQAEAGEAGGPRGATTRVLEQLKQDLRLTELPRHIECFDNSNTQGTDPVSACVVFKDAKPSKKDYRHFNIRTVEGPDDFASMEEAVERRYSRLLTEGEPLPQLIVIDGGKGQLQRRARTCSTGWACAAPSPSSASPRSWRRSTSRRPLSAAHRQAQLQPAGDPADAQRGAPLRHHAPPQQAQQAHRAHRPGGDPRHRSRHRAEAAQTLRQHQGHPRGHAGGCGGRGVGIPGEEGGGGATATPGEVRMDLYHQFRTGLLKHIKMEEKILFPAAQKANGGTPLPLAAKLRLDHGALTALMVTPPTPEVLRLVRLLLEQHDLLEEEHGGMYEACETLTASETDAILEALSQATEVPVHPHNETDNAFKAAKNALVRAGFDPGELGRY